MADESTNRLTPRAGRAPHVYPAPVAKRNGPWYATKQASRRRRMATFTLSEEAIARLEWLAESLGETKSEIVEELIMGADDEGKEGER